MTDIHTDPVLGVIGGSGLYDIDGLENIQWREIQSAWGEPSDALLCGQLGDISLVFLPRHGRGHRLSPTTINYRANIDVFKRAGVTDIISLSAVGSFREELSPGTFVIVDQFIDRTFAREKSFFGRGLVAHVSMARPVNPRLADWCESACRSEGIPAHLGGTYLAMEGPQFSTFAESQMYRQWGCDVIGMTNMPEAKLAREAEIPYCTVAMVTDYDCWHPDHDHVTVENIIAVLFDNADKGRALVKQIASKLAERSKTCGAGCQTALDNAIITAPDARDTKMAAKLDAIAGRVLSR